MKNVYVLYWASDPFMFIEGTVLFQDDNNVVVRIGDDNISTTSYIRKSNVCSKTKENKAILTGMRKLSEKTNKELINLRDKLKPI